MDKYDFTVFFSVEDAESETLFRFMRERFSVSPSFVRRKGEYISQALGLLADRDMWVIKEQYPNAEDINEVIDGFIQKYSPILENIEELKGKFTIKLRLSVVSLVGQMLFVLSSDVQKKLAQIGLPLELSVFSYGGVTE